MLIVRQTIKTGKTIGLTLPFSSNKFIQDIKLLDEKGKIVYSVLEGKDVGTNLITGIYTNVNLASAIETSIKSLETNLSLPEGYISSRNRPFSFLIKPIAKNDLVGVILFQLDLNNFFSQINSFENKTSRYLVDSKSMVNINKNEQSNLIPISPLALNNINHDLNFEPKFISSLEVDAQDQIYYIQKLNNPLVDWYLLSETKKPALSFTILELNYTVILLILLVLLAVGFTYFYIVKKITHPISRLVKATEDVSAGKLEFQIEVIENNEIGRLANSFNKMLLKRRLYEHNLHESHRKITEALRELSQQKYALDQHAIVDVSDTIGRITYVNDKFCAVSGFSRKDILGKTHKIISSGQHDDAFFKQLYLSITRGFVWHGEICNKSKEGREFWLDTTIIPFMDLNNNPESYIAIRTDITNRIEAQKKLQDNEEKFLLAQKTAKLGHFEFDLINRNWIFSQELSHILELDKLTTLNDNSLLDLINSEYKSVFSDKLARFLNQELNNLDLEYPITSAISHQQKWLHMLAKFKFDNNKKPVQLFGTIQDITQRKRMEVALQRAEKMEAIGQLTGGIAHDFNNILGIIIGNLDILDDTLQGNNLAKKRIASATKAALRAERLTKQLLGISRKKSFQYHATNINKVIQGMEDMFIQTAGKDTKVKLDLSENLWNTKIDSGDLQDSLLNMVINSRDSITSNGLIKIETSNITFDEASDNIPKGDYIKIKIIDNGHGISEEIQQKIFEPFFTTKPTDKGSGMGLSMVFGFIKRSGGYIRLNSTINLGTSFKIYLPRSFNELEQSTTEYAPNELVPASYKGMSILLVDDEKELLDIANQYLTNSGFSVSTAGSYEQALEILKAPNCFDLLISDVVMSGNKSGYDLAEYVSNQYPTTKILLVSGYTGNASVEDKIKNKYTLIAKPYTQEILMSAISLSLSSDELKQNGYTNLDLTHKGRG